MQIRAASPRNFHIPLATSSDPLCKVIAPDKPNWEQLAHRFCVRVREYARVEPEQITPHDVIDEDFERYHLVLFGSILDNPAILKLCQRGLCFTDAAYPGIGGVEIRTVVNPFGCGKNVLLIGGSDYRQVHEAVIGLHRSFSQVTTERDGAFVLHRLNFCVSERNCHWRPSEAEVEKIVAGIDRAPETRFHRAADFALYHYQTDTEAWASLFQRVMRPAFEGPPTSEGMWKLARAWSLVQSSPRFDDDFRAETDRLLLRAGERIASEWKPAYPLTVEASSAALALTRIGEHLDRRYGENPFAERDDAIRRMFAVNDPVSRDWLVVDQWLSALLREERYDLLESGALLDLSREILASADNLKSAVGDPQGLRHALNVLTKIAAFLDDGRPLWIRRWLNDEEDVAHPIDKATVAWNWYTGPYEPDCLPREPRAAPRISPVYHDKTERDKTGKEACSVAFRHDLDSSHEYMSLGRGVKRLTWRARSWLTGGAWDESNDAIRLVSKTDLPGFGHATLDCNSWTRRVFWRFNEFFLFVDERTDAIGSSPLTTAWRADEGDFERHKSEWRLRRELGTFRLATVAGEPLDRWEPNNLTRATLLTMDAQLALTRESPFVYRVGDARCSVGPLTSNGLEIDATAVCLDGNGLWCAGFRAALVDGADTLVCDDPIALRVGLAKGDGHVYVRKMTTLRWESAEQRLEPGEYKTRFEGFNWEPLRRLASRDTY